jgi:hypothetical protein
MFEIVKRQHIRPAGDLVPRTSPGPQPWVSDMLGKQKHVFGESRRQVFLFWSCSACSRADIDHESNQVS